jgi:repressor LexA
MEIGKAMGADKNALSPRQRDMLEIIVGCVRDNFRVPTLRELCSRMDIRSTNGVYCHLRRMEVKGWIGRHERTRNIVLTDKTKKKYGLFFAHERDLDAEKRAAWFVRNYSLLLQYVHGHLEPGATYEEIQAAAGCEILLDGKRINDVKQG